jgi:hypothetical protein
MKGLISLIFLLLVSCVSMEHATARRLAGEWLYADKMQSCRYIFRSDGTFNGEVLVRAKLVSKFTGRWSVEGHTLSYQYEKDLLGRIPPGALDRDSLLTVQRDSFTIEAADGSQRKYRRVR